MIRLAFNRLAELLLFQRGERCIEIRKLSLATLNDDDFLSSAALFWTQTCWIWALAVTGWSWIFAFILFDLTLYVGRWRLRHGMSLFVRCSDATFPRLAAWLNLLMIAQISVETFSLLQVSSLQTTILAVFIAMGFSGYIVGIFVAFPVLAGINITALNLALGLGLATSVFKDVRPLAVLSIGSAIAFCSLMRRTHGSLLDALVAQHTSRQLSLHDPLTKLPNRTFMRERLTQFISMPSDKNKSVDVAVLCLDLDEFKEINDRYGHAAGDWVLTRVAEVLLSSLQTGDFACRVGGDEFVVLLAQAAAARVHLVADAIISAVAVPFDIGRVIPVRIGISIGAAIANDSIKEIDQLLEEADNALYKAKRLGKGCVQLHDGCGGGDTVVVNFR